MTQPASQYSKAQLNILTRPPKLFFPGAGRYFVKWAIKKMLNKKRGPDGVLESLKRGLHEIGQPFLMNAPLEKGQMVNVISNIEALRYAIAHKQEAGIARLIAGPNLIVLPDEHDSLLANPQIDIVLTVSPWISELYGKIIPALIPKMHIWPAGVQVPALPAHAISNPNSGTPSDLKNTFIVFKKKVPNDIYEKVINVLKSRNLEYEVFEYGTFKQSEYFAALDANGMTEHVHVIYLQESESQGIALQEAWIRNVPTLVWNNGSYTSTTGVTVTGNVAAPFLTDEAGMTFSGMQDFEAVFDTFIMSKSFSPRSYCLRELTDKASAEIYLKAIHAGI